MGIPGTDVFVALGSNVDPLDNIPAAVRLLAMHVPITGLSGFYQTVPIGRAGQPDFVNAVARVRTSLPHRSFKQNILRPIEEKLGRRREEDRYAPRTIDLDILVFGDLQSKEPDFLLPDPDIATRGFLARCLLDIEPNLVLPGETEPLAASAPQFEGEELSHLTRQMRSLWLGPEG